MADIIHFKSAKKKAEYARKNARAAENRVRFGRSKAEKNLEKMAEKKRQERLDDHKITGDD